jgi:dTDP-4-dehydrorhamnose reductase
MNKKILITGARSGLGKFLSKKYENVICITRENPLTEELFYGGVDKIIYCAFNSNNDDLTNMTEKCYNDNISLLLSTLKIPHKKFIHISSVQVSPHFNNSYGRIKKLQEYIVRENSENYCILRPSSLTGHGMGYNTFSKIVDGKDITLTSDSVNDAVLYEDVYDAIEKDINGTYFLLSRESITMKEMAKLFNKNIKFGNYHYDVSQIKSDIDIGRTSEEVIKKYFGEIE